MIVKDDTEVERLRRSLNSSAKWVDGIFITGTKNPQKKIKALCKEYGATWSWFDWVKDFSAARNYNFSQVPKEYDWIFWCDTDDMLHGGESFRSVVENAEKLNIKAVFARYLYQVELDEQGGIKNILIEHLRERLLRNDGTYEWIAPIHETLIERVPSGKTDTNDFFVIHLSRPEDMVNSMYRNIEILEEEVMRKPEDPRPIYYLAKAYFDLKTPELLYEPASPGMDSITVELLKDYLRKSGWAEERAQAWEYLSMIHRERNEHKMAIACLLEAVTEAPKFISIYIQLALTYVVIKEWDKALHWAKIAGSLESPKTTLVINPRDYKSMLLEAYFHIYLNTGKIQECLRVCRGLVDILPTDVNKQRLKDLEDLVYRNELAHWTVKLANHLWNTKQIPQLKAIINSIPREIVNEPTLQDLRHQFMPPETHSDKNIVIYCGPGFEQWSPKSTAKGIGGSEEAVINMGRELTKLGWEVIVYGDPGDNTGDHEGVKYVPYSEINWKDRFNILISWRQIGLFDTPGLYYKKAYLWNHDIQNPMTYTKERVDKIDKIMFLSKWHRSNVPSLDESKVMYSANGI